MVYIEITAWYPPNKQAENMKATLQVAQKYPDRPELGETVATMVSSDADGIKTRIIVKVKEGKYEEIIAHIAKLMSSYWGIEGYRYAIKTWITLEEAYAVIGQKPPD